MKNPLKRVDTKKKRDSRFRKTFRVMGFSLFLTISLIYLIPTVLVSIYSGFPISEQVTTEGTPAYFWNLFTEQVIKPINTIRTIQTENTLKTSVLFICGTLILLFFIRFLEIWRRFKPHEVEDASDYGAYDSARWATGKEILAKDDFISDYSNPETFGDLIGETLDTHLPIVRKSNSEINSHTMVVAGSGTGKTQGYVLNQIILNKMRSIFGTDGKGELYQLTSKLKAAEGFKILYIDFVKFIGDRWNPLSSLEFDEIDNFTTSLVESADDDSKNIWGAHAINLISACIAYVFETEKKIHQNMTFVRRLINLSESDIKELFEDLPDGSIAKDYFSEVSESKDKVWEGIVATAKSATRFWKQQRIRNFTSVSDFEFTDLGTQKVAMYVRIHPTDKTYTVLINTFFKQLFNKLIEGVDDYGGRYPIEIDFRNDEFTNVGKIAGFQSILSFVRALGLNISTVVQDISQLRLTYGEDDTRSMISNCDNFVFLGTNESEKTAPFIEQKLGSTTKIIRNEQGKAKDISHVEDGQQYTHIKRSLMTVSEILKMDKSLGIYFPGGSDPIKFKKMWTYQLFPDLEKAEFGWHIDQKKREKEAEEQRSGSALDRALASIDHEELEEELQLEQEEIDTDLEQAIDQEPDDDFLPY